MLSMFKALLLAACVALVIGDGHEIDCESAEVKACEEFGLKCLADFASCLDAASVTKSGECKKKRDMHMPLS